MAKLLSSSAVLEKRKRKLKAKIDESAAAKTLKFVQEGKRERNIILTYSSSSSLALPKIVMAKSKENIFSENFERNICCWANSI